MWKILIQNSGKVWKMVLFKLKEYFIVDNFDGKNQILFGIFDGHGGNFCSQFLKNNFANVNIKILKGV